MKNIVLASYFNTKKDPLRKTSWPSDVGQVEKLIKSVVDKNSTIKIFHDCFVEPPSINNCEFIKVSLDLNYSTNVFRWFVYLDHIKQNNYNKIFMVDSTDVIMQISPFEHIKNEKLYIGSEFNQTIPHKYLNKRRHLFDIGDWTDVMEQHAKHPLLNCGICGGEKNIVEQFLKILTDTHEKQSYGVEDSLDMPIFNYVLYKYFNNQIVTGEPVHTKFKRYEINDTSWWSHK